MLKYEVQFYEKENGESPVEDFISSLDMKLRAKLVGLLEVLEEKGNFLRNFFWYQGTIVLTNGFVKKT